MSTTAVRAGAALAACMGLAVGQSLAGQAPPPSSILLDLPSSTRSAGLGGAAVALNGDAASIFVNPAGLATIRHIGLEGSLQRFTDGSLLNRGAGALRIYRFDLGAGYQYIRYNQPAPLVGSLRWMGSIGYRRGMIALATNLNYTSVEDSSGHIDRALSAGVGMQIAVFDLMALGISVQDFGDHAISGVGLTLPTAFKIGYTLNFVDPQSNKRLLMTIEGNFTHGRPGRAAVGAEAGIVLSGIGIVIRGGYSKAPPGIAIGEGSAGASLILSPHAAVDYAYQPRTPLGGHLHQLGVRLTL
ncbi:MAG: hypothetical protein ABI765_02265 [Gemmatimonadota bacterium]